MSYKLAKSTRLNKKWQVTLPSGKRYHFGATGYEDYTYHKDEKRKASYLARHAKREDWTRTGLATAGFWSRWLLWNKPSIEASKRDIEQRFGIKIL